MFPRSVISCVRVCERAHVYWGETASSRMWKGYKTIKALLRGVHGWQASHIRCNRDPTMEHSGRSQINVMCIAYREQGQMFHLTDTLDTLDIHNGHEPWEGQLDAFHLKLHPSNLKRILLLISQGLRSGSLLFALIFSGLVYCRSYGERQFYGLCLC